jgi:hypothetical protein
MNGVRGPGGNAPSGKKKRVLEIKALGGLAEVFEGEGPQRVHPVRER